jgi:hypothetical protein
MSWIFGVKPNPPTPSDILGVDINPPQQAGGGGSGDGGKDPPKDSNKRGIETNYRFDSAALERAAAAAKELEKSKHAKEVCRKNIFIFLIFHELICNCSCRHLNSQNFRKRQSKRIMKPRLQSFKRRPSIPRWMLSALLLKKEENLWQKR